MLGGILAEWALDVPEQDLSINIEPLPQSTAIHELRAGLTLRCYLAADGVRSKLEGAPLPPHA